MEWIALASPRRLPAPSPPPDWPALACWAGRYTPRVTLAGVDAPMLRFEVAGSLRLFGGRNALLQRLRADLARMDCPLLPALAATPRAAAWLAGGGVAACCPDAAATRAALAGLPLAALPLEADIAQRLTGFGMTRLGEVMALPRAAAAARLGAGFLRDLARALGEIAEPLPWFVFPERFESALELPAAVDAAPALLFAARRLIGALAGWLAVRQVVVREIVWRIAHDDAGPTLLPLRFAVPVQSPARIERVLKEALGRLRLPAPARALHLATGPGERCDGRSRALFDELTGEAGLDAFAELLDRLRARLGEPAVQGVQRHADHRPERATVAVPPVWRRPPNDRRGGPPFGDGTPAIARQPLWLLARPQALTERNGRPWRDGPLTLVAGPERIESGWWDDDDMRRDYFVALDARERWLWIYRRCEAPAGWFLHGEFA